MGLPGTSVAWRMRGRFIKASWKVETSLSRASVGSSDPPAQHPLKVTECSLQAPRLSTITGVSPSRTVIGMLAVGEPLAPGITFALFRSTSTPSSLLMSLPLVSHRPFFFLVLIVFFPVNPNLALPEASLSRSLILLFGFPFLRN